ncbi:hypothetical protein LCGC14_2377900 [marine sediment metagenome]|uniref:Uncharacterized protein n=1 Tax=marine sediment metagenome TaxID=412755 RepID=A0A0F9EE66_9ZZZZ
MTNKEKKLWTARLRPFWKLRDKAHDKFRKREMEIEKLMKKATGEDLEFFYTDEGACVGIGHSDVERRSSKKEDYFPLVHDIWLM